MPKLRFRSIFNWLLLFLNIVLLIFPVSGLLLPINKATAEARKAATAMDMDVYVAKDPFVLLVDKNFPRDRSFVFNADEQMLSVSVTDTATQGDADAKREVMVTLGSEFSISCDCSVTKDAPWVKVKKIVLSTEEQQGLVVGLTDLNADGFYDLRQRHKEQQSFPIQIWYRGEWRDLAADEGLHGGGGVYKTNLPDVGEVTFDAEKGAWLSSGDGAPAERE